MQSGQNMARDLGNRPGNILFPLNIWQNKPQALAAEYPDLLKVTILDEAEMRCCR